MDARFKIGAVGFIVTMPLLSIFNPELMHGFGGIFVTLAALLIFAVFALFPSINRGDMVDRSKAGGTWSDHIEFDHNEESDKIGESWR